MKRSAILFLILLGYARMQAQPFDPNDSLNTEKGRPDHYLPDDKNKQEFPELISWSAVELNCGRIKLTYQVSGTDTRVTTSVLRKNKFVMNNVPGNPVVLDLWPDTFLLGVTVTNKYDRSIYRQDTLVTRKGFLVQSSAYPGPAHGEYILKAWTEANVAGLTYYWYRNSGSGVTNLGLQGDSIVQYLFDNYTYIVKGVDSHGCTGNSILEIQVSPSRASLPGDRIPVFPNPADDVLYLPHSYAGTRFFLYDFSGAVKHSGLVEEEGMLPVSFLPAGMYLLRVDLAEGSRFSRIIVAR